MIDFAMRFRNWLRSGRWLTLGSVWPFKTMLEVLDRRHEAKEADALSEKIAALDKKTRSEKYSRATNTHLLKHQRAISSLDNEVIATARKNRSGTLTSTNKLHDRYDSLLVEVTRMLNRDANWRTRAAHLRNQRTELWEQATKWSPAWQRTITLFIAEVDEALKFARLTGNPEDQLTDAKLAVGRLQSALDYVKKVGDCNKKAIHVAARIEKLKPIEGSYLSQDKSSFYETLAAGQEAFAIGEYVAARRHLDAALRLANRVLTTERSDRLKQKNEAKQWVTILGNKDLSAKTITAEITSVLENSSSLDFHADWEQLHKKIDDHVLARACEMGNRDQKAIAKRIGDKRTVKWRENIQWNDLLRFSQAVVKEL